MVKDNRLYIRIEPFSALFWALGIVLARAFTRIGDPACHPSTIVLARYCTAGVSLVQFE